MLPMKGIPATAIPVTVIPVTAIPATAIPATAIPATATPATALRGALTVRDNYLIPKVLIHSDRYKNLQTDAAVLYAVLFDKSIMSDDDDDVLIGDDGRRLFITSPVSEIIADLDFVDKRAEILLRELDSEGLVKVVGQGNGSLSGIIVFPVSEGIDRPAAKGIDCLPAEVSERPAHEEPECPAVEELERPASEELDRPASEELERPAHEEPECPASEELDRPASEVLERPASEKLECPASERIGRREVSSVKLRYIGSPIVAEPLEAVTDSVFVNIEPGPVYTQVDSERELVPNGYMPLHEHQTPVSDSFGNAGPAHNTDSADFAPHPVSNRIIALQYACNNEFSPSDVRELWISMQDVIDEDRWDDLDFLSGWLRSMYTEMHSRVAGGDKFVRIALLQDLISEK